MKSSLLILGMLMASLPCLAHDDHDEALEHEHESEHEHNHEGDHDHGAPVAVHADAKSRAVIRMQIETVPQPGAALVDSVYGRLVAPQHETETYALPVGGRIELRVKTAQAVKKGEVLYAVQSPAVAEQLAAIRTLQSNRERCVAEAEVMAARLERLKAAEARNSELEEQYHFKQAEQAQLEREIQAAETRLRMLCMGADLVQENELPTLLVRAESDGTVRNVGLTQGSWGEQGSAVLTLSRPQALEIEAALYGSAAPEVSEVRALVPQGRALVPVAGTWRFSEQVNPETQTRTLYFTPESLPEEARAGQLCRLDLYKGAAEDGDVVTIPDSAVIRVGTDDVVFTEEGEGEYLMHKVHAGASRRGMTPVEGLKPGQRIVVKGGYELKFSLPSQGAAKKAGHFHADGKFHEGEDE